MNIGNKKSQLEIFDFLRRFYPEDTKFIVLSMDMEYMGAGKVIQGFIQQLDELSQIKKTYSGQFFPFICADPRRPNIVEIVRKYIEEHDFQGIKIYPPLGYYPFDERLYPIFGYAEAHKIPIISHCSPPVVFYRGKIKRKMLIHPRNQKRFEITSHQDFAKRLADPENYHYLLKDFPKLKVCLAHFGGESEWRKYLLTPWDESMEKSWFSSISNLTKTHPDVYSDISYMMHNADLHPLLKVVLQDQKMRPKILFGSDFYMTELGISERSFSINLRAYLGEEDFQQIAERNPGEFLRLNQ